MYDKKLKRGKDGSFTRYIGQNARGVPEKLRLGYDQEAPEQEVRLMAALWTEIEGRTSSHFRPSWDRASLDAAKAIAKGNPPAFPRLDSEDPLKYAQRVADISQTAGIPFQPTDDFLYRIGLEDLRKPAGEARQKLPTPWACLPPPGRPAGRRWPPTRPTSGGR